MSGEGESTHKRWGKCNGRRDTRMVLMYHIANGLVENSRKRSEHLVPIAVILDPATANIKIHATRQRHSCVTRFARLEEPPHRGPDIEATIILSSRIEFELTPRY